MFDIPKTDDYEVAYRISVARADEVIFDPRDSRKLTVPRRRYFYTRQRWSFYQVGRPEIGLFAVS